MNQEARMLISTVLNTQRLAPCAIRSPLPLELPIDVPSRYRKATLHPERDTPALGHVRAFLGASPQGCLILSGSPGCGKTYAATAGLITSAFRSRRFAFYPAVCHTLIAFATRDETARALSSARLLLLDDFGAGAYPLASGGWTDATLSGLFDGILTHREANHLPTIITTNLTGAELSERLSTRLRSRLNGGWGKLCSVSGPDLRQEGL